MKKIIHRLHPVCSLADCPREGRPMNVVVYEDGSYRGGHHFNFNGRLDYWECPTCFWHPKTTKPLNKEGV